MRNHHRLRALPGNRHGGDGDPPPPSWPTFDRQSPPRAASPDPADHGRDAWWNTSLAADHTATCRAGGCDEPVFCSFTTVAPWGMFATMVCRRHLEDCLHNRFHLTDTTNVQDDEDDHDDGAVQQVGPW